MAATASSEWPIQLPLTVTLTISDFVSAEYPQEAYNHGSPSILASFQVQTIQFAAASTITLLLQDQETPAQHEDFKLPWYCTSTGNKN